MALNARGLRVSRRAVDQVKDRFRGADAHTARLAHPRPLDFGFLHVGVRDLPLTPTALTTHPLGHSHSPEIIFIVTDETPEANYESPLYRKKYDEWERKRTAAHKKLCASCLHKLTRPRSKRADEKRCTFQVCRRCTIPYRAWKMHPQWKTCIGCTQFIHTRNGKAGQAFKQLDRLAGSNSHDLAQIAKVAKILLKALGNNPKDLVCELLATHSHKERKEKLTPIERRGVMTTAVLNLLTATELIKHQEAQAQKIERKSLRELSNDELKNALIPLAAQLVTDNPSLAVRALQEAGYEVKISKRS